MAIRNSASISGLVRRNGRELTRIEEILPAFRRAFMWLIPAELIGTLETGTSYIGAGSPNNPNTG